MMFVFRWVAETVYAAVGGRHVTVSRPSPGMTLALVTVGAGAAGAAGVTAAAGHALVPITPVVLALAGVVLPIPAVALSPKAFTARTPILLKAVALASPENVYE